jgi:SRSO17 transposase
MADWEERFDDYVERLGDVLGHADRRAPLRAYATGLLLPGERESVEPMAARRWRRASTRAAWARRTSPCTTSSPRPPGTTPPC